MPRNLLVADDSLTMRKVIGMIFSTEDFQIHAVDNGIDAIHKARELRPDVILADVMMPGASGYEVCEALKADPNTTAIPVVLLAGTFEPFDENRARTARADDHITKPFESQVLLDKVKALLGIKGDAPAPAPYRPPVAAQPSVPVPGAAPTASRNTRPGGLPAAGPAPGVPQPAPGMRPGVPMHTPAGGIPGARPMPGMPPPGVPRPQTTPIPPPGMPRPPGPGIPGVAGMRPGIPGVPPPGVPRPMTPGPGTPSGGIPRAVPLPPGARPMGVPGMPPPGMARPPQAAPAPQPRQDPFGFGAGQPQPQQLQRPRAPQPPLVVEEQMPVPRGAEEISIDVGGAQPHAARADGGEAALRQALSQASREVIEKIAWEVVPQLAETIIREELDRLIKEREGKG
ncbi:MAG TPA: response regulator [Myxococcaceae bacterium]|nr:response regulator [Myxococcaceae bacterium]